MTALPILALTDHHHDSEWHGCRWLAVICVLVWMAIIAPWLS